MRFQSILSLLAVASLGAVVVAAPPSKTVSLNVTSEDGTSVVYKVPLGANKKTEILPTVAARVGQVAPFYTESDYICVIFADAPFLVIQESLCKDCPAVFEGETVLGLQCNPLAGTFERDP